MQSDDSCALDPKSLDDDVGLTVANWGWEKACQTFGLSNNNQVATRQRGTRPDYAGVMGPKMESGIYEVSAYRLFTLTLHTVLIDLCIACIHSGSLSSPEMAQDLG